MNRNKYNIITCLVLFLIATLTSCVLDEEITTNLPLKKVSLTISGKMAISRTPIESGDNSESLTINSVRVIIFHGESVVFNDKVNAEYEWKNDAYILSIQKQSIETFVGENTIYVVLNEEVDAGVSTSLQDENITLTTKQNLCNGKITYDPSNYSIISEPTTDEPAFLMCTYDNINITGTAIYDITGLENNAIYGFPMRRSMAKIVLDEIIGGVHPNGIIVGTDKYYDSAATEDQTGSNDYCTINSNGVIIESSNSNISLAKTNEIMIKKVELINVPAKYTWADNESEMYDDSNGYVDAINITRGMTNKLGYIDRNWKGSITTDGTVDFTRTDALPALWKYEGNSSSYGFEERYGFDNPYIKNPESALDYSSNGDYYLNSGGFVQYIKDAYGENGSLEFEEGPIVPKNLQLSSTLNPGIWTITPNVSFYIPENIQPDKGKYTSLRIYYTIASIMADITDEELKEAINSALENNKVPIVGEDGKTLIINRNDNWQAEGVTYIRERGHFVENPTRLGDGLNSKNENVGNAYDKKWGIKYDGIETIWSGTGVIINDRPGYYYADNTYEELYIDIPLTNDEHQNVNGNEDSWDYDSNSDNNIYRGCEYRVKLYVTRQGKLDGRGLSSRTINIGGEELTITGKVTASPIK